MADCASAGLPIHNFLFRRGLLPPIFGGCKLLFFFHILKSGVPNLSVANPVRLASSAFYLVSFFLLQDEVLEPYLQRHTYTFEVQERVMPGRDIRHPLLLTFLSPEIATSINIHVPFSLSRIIMSGLLLGIVLSVCTC